MAITLEEMNSMDFDVFLEKFGNIIEHGSIVVAALWTKRPFASVQHVLNETWDIVDSLPIEGKWSQCYDIQQIDTSQKRLP
jgi:2-oxo-4-hydroxy-4-carboxy--5-ureidoimidazoline (OHCU) decarboxylase